MQRRTALANIGLLTGSIFLLPYACERTPILVFSNFPSIRINEQALTGQICNCILPEDPINFATPESRVHFVLTMINDCGSDKEISTLIQGLSVFKKSLSTEDDMAFQKLSAEKQNEYIGLQFEAQSSSTDLLNLLKRHSILHFESSENYLTKYLKYEFMPGRYYGRVAVEQTL